MKPKRDVALIRPAHWNDVELRVIRRLALTVGSEQGEANEILESDMILMAEKGGKPIGFVSLRVTEQSLGLEITGLAVIERERRKGVAKLLLEHAEGIARNVNAKSLTVRTSNDNIPALALYQKSGFRITATRLGVLIQHHGGKELAGWNRIPVRDEMILEKKL